MMDKIQMILISAVADNEVAASEIDRINKASFGDPWSKSQVLDELNNPAAKTVCAYIDGRICAYGGYLKIADTAEIMNIAVEPGCRGKGLGKAVLQALEREAKKEGLGKIFLELRAGNAAARGLYAGAGFAEDGCRKNYYKNPAEDAVLMSKETRIIDN